MNERDTSHAWLLIGDVIVDITAFQFDDSINSVIFNKDSEFHSQFKGATSYPYDSFMTDLKKEVFETYAKIVEHIE